MGRLKQPLYWAWALVIVWGSYSAYALFSDRGAGLIIAIIGLVSALLIATVFHSRRRKSDYPGAESRR